MTEQTDNRGGWRALTGRLMELVPARLRRAGAVVPVVRLSGVIGQVWAQDRQFRMLCWTGGAALALGLLLSPIVAGFFPFGLNARVAALVMREDRWTAGGDLMRTANPQAWARLSQDAELLKDNQDAMDVCRAALARTGESQHCVVTLTPPQTADPKQRSVSSAR